MTRVFGSLSAIVVSAAPLSWPRLPWQHSPEHKRWRNITRARSIRSPCRRAFTRPVIGQILPAGVSVPRPEASARPRRRNAFAGKQFARLSARRALRTEKYFAERAARANIPKALGILKRAGVGNPPMKGDRLRRKKQT